MATTAGHSIANMTARVEMRMSLLDVAFQLMDSVRSPQDFSLILHFRDALKVDGLYAGARSAMNRFPISASCVDGQSWVWRENKYFKLEIVSDCESRSAIERFVDAPFDLHHQPPVKQSLILDGPTGATLVTRFHHSAADGLSAALWLGHQLNVAYDLEAVETERAPFVDLPLRRLPTSARRSDFAFDRASDRLWTSNSERSGARRWMTIAFPASELQRACRRVGGFTYNDLLATCTLEVFSRWNAMQLDNSHQPRIGLWMPMNIRREANVGFGNGTSRIRLYARYKDDAPLVEKCRDVRRQVSWTTQHGEWVVPEMPWFTRVPRAITRPLLRSYLNLSSVDMCTGVFSHAGSWIASAGEAFKHVDRIECVGLLHERQSLAVNAATHHGQTWLSLTYDPRLLSAEEVQQIGQMYEQQVDLARHELL